MLPLLPRMPLIRLLRRALHLAGEDGRLRLLPIEAELVAVGEHAPTGEERGYPATLERLLYSAPSGARLSSLWRAFHGPPHARQSVGPLPQDVSVAAPLAATRTAHCTRDTVSFCCAMFQRLSTCISPLRSLYGRCR